MIGDVIDTFRIIEPAVDEKFVGTLESRQAPVAV